MLEKWHSVPIFWSLLSVPSLLMLVPGQHQSLQSLLDSSPFSAEFRSRASQGSLVEPSLHVERPQSFPLDAVSLSRRSSQQMRTNEKLHVHGVWERLPLNSRALHALG